MKLTHCYHNKKNLQHEGEKCINMLNCYVVKQWYFSEANKRIQVQWHVVPCHWVSDMWCHVTGLVVPSISNTLEDEGIKFLCNIKNHSPSDKVTFHTIANYLIFMTQGTLLIEHVHCAYMCVCACAHVYVCTWVDPKFSGLTL